MKQIHNSEALLFWKIAIFLGFTNPADSPNTETRADFIKLHLYWESRYWRTDVWIYIYVNALRIWVWNAKTALPWNRSMKRLQFVKPTCHKIYPGRYNNSMKAFISINTCASSDREPIAMTISQSLMQQFRSFELYLQILACLTGWGDTQNMGKLQQINFVLFEIYVWKLIIRIEGWFLMFPWGMNGITNMHIFVCVHRLFYSYFKET